MKKTYFQDEDSEIAYSKEYFDRIMIDENKTEIEVFEAVPVPEEKEEFVFCQLADECCEKSDCGKQCEDYEPTSETNSKCQHKGIYCDFGEKVILKLHES